jgi:type IV pilus assembly protein PilW
MSAIQKSAARGVMRTRSRMQGLSLIELMIAMTISLMVLAAVGWVYQGTMQTYRSHDSLSRLQEGARYAFEVMGRDMRMAGATGCSHDIVANAFEDADEWYGNLFERPLSSINQDAAAAAGEVNKVSDALRVLKADVSREYIVQAHAAGTSDFTLTENHDVTNGQLMVATDCNRAALFQVSATTADTISHGVGGTPGNSTPNLGVAGAVATFLPGSRLYRMDAVTYYVADNAAGVPSLFRMRPVGVDAELTPEELVEGVEDMRVTYGVDTSGDGQVDFYDNEVGGFPYVSGDYLETDAGFAATPKERWDRVVSVRVSLLMRSAEDRVIPVPQQYAFLIDPATGLPSSVTADDRRLRKVFTHVIKLRNR